MYLQPTCLCTPTPPPQEKRKKTTVSISGLKLSVANSAQENELYRQQLLPITWDPFGGETEAGATELQTCPHEDSPQLGMGRGYWQLSEV